MAGARTQRAPAHELTKHKQAPRQTRALVTCRLYSEHGLVQDVERQAAAEEGHVVRAKCHGFVDANVVGKVAHENAAVIAVVLLRGHAHAAVPHFRRDFSPAGHAGRDGVARVLLRFVGEELLQAVEVALPAAAHRVVVLDFAFLDVGDGEAPVGAAHVDGHHHLAELEHVAVGAAYL